MLVKLFFGILLAAGLLLMLRGGIRGAPASKQPDADAAPVTVTPRQIAYGLVAVIVVVSLGASYLQWRGSHEVVTVRLINSRTGEATSYVARLADVGTRSFRTLDGHTVTVADVDRMEIITE